MKQMSEAENTSAPSSFNRRLLLISGLGLAMGACSREESIQVVSKADGVPGTPRPLPAPLTARAVNAPDIEVGTFLLPGLVESTEEGPVIDLIKAIAATYTGGKFVIHPAPLARVASDLVNGTTDAFVPDLRRADEGQLKYRFSTQSIGQVHFVLYSRKTAPVRTTEIQQAQGKSPADFPYTIETIVIPWGFPTVEFTDLTSAFKKLDAGHIHAFLWAQEEADAELRRLGLKNIVREEFRAFEDVFAITKGPRGDFVDNILSKGIAQLRDSGELQRLYSRIHKPYDPWQP